MLSDRFHEAFLLAAALHGSQVRKGSRVPYLSHLMAVSALVLEDGGDEDEAIAGLLHDAAEDQGGQRTLEQIRQRFGERVAHIVAGCSDTVLTPKPPWRERKEAYIAHLASADESTVRVSLADKIHNARDVLMTYRLQGEDSWARFKGGRDGTLWYYRAVTDAFWRRRQDERVRELDRIVTTLEQLAS